MKSPAGFLTLSLLGLLQRPTLAAGGYDEVQEHQQPLETSPLAKPTVVQTTSGLVTGHMADWPAGNNVIEFLGIPYAQPPVGDLRFAAPKALENATDHRVQADNFSMDCIQLSGNALLSGYSPRLQAYGAAMGAGTPENPHVTGEDCLTANVWTKASSSTTKKAVLLWIYGGGFTIGTTNAPFYSGARLAQDEDVVVVSINYRLNIFGFPNAPGLAAQNVGLLDQRLAVEWVRDNIAAFGGDPDRITLFGESAGAASVDLYAFAWTHDPIVNGFIAQSGAAYHSRAPVAHEAWYSVSNALGCGGAEAGEATVACMRTKDAKDIAKATGRAAAAGRGFGPAADEKVVFSSVPARSAAGDFIRKPLLIGVTDFEVGLVRALPPSANFGGLQPSAPDSAIRLASELAFGCAAAHAARDRRAHGVPAWRYRYMAVWDNVALTNDTGAYHSSEIPLVFGTNARRPNASADTEEEVALSRGMVRAWAAFAKDPEGGLVGLEWPVYEEGGRTLVKLGEHNRSALAVGPSGEFDTVCSVMPEEQEL